MSNGQVMRQTMGYPLMDQSNFPLKPCAKGHTTGRYKRGICIGCSMVYRVLQRVERQEARVEQVRLNGERLAANAVRRATQMPLRLRRKAARAWMRK